MGCSCGSGNRIANIKRQVRNVVLNNPSNVIGAANLNTVPVSNNEAINNERRVIEMKRRERILKAMKRP